MTKYSHLSQASKARPKLLPHFSPLPRVGCLLPSTRAVASITTLITSIVSTLHHYQDHLGNHRTLGQLATVIAAGAVVLATVLTSSSHLAPP